MIGVEDPVIPRMRTMVHAAEGVAMMVHAVQHQLPGRMKPTTGVEVAMLGPETTTGVVAKTAAEMMEMTIGVVVAQSLERTTGQRLAAAQEATLLIGGRRHR